MGELTHEIQFPIAEAILYDAQQWGIEIMRSGQECIHWFKHFSTWSEFRGMIMVQPKETRFSAPT